NSSARQCITSQKRSRTGPCQTERLSESIGVGSISVDHPRRPGGAALQRRTPASLSNLGQNCILRAIERTSTETRMSSNDPKKIHKQPPYSGKQQPPPGSEEEMRPQADHGEATYKGTGRLEGRHALITGADSGIGRA